MIPDQWLGKVQNGRLVLDVETDLPEGTEVPLSRWSPLPEGPRCDVLLFVTTETERRVLRELAGKRDAKEIPGRYSEYLDLGQVHPQYRVFAVETEMGALQAGGSATKALLCPIETGARVIIAVGMAFGIDRGSQKFGDVLVASHLLPYDSVIVDTDNDGRLPRVRYDQITPTATNPTLVSLLLRHIDKAQLPYQVHFGAMLSGSAQIRCRAHRDHLAAKLNKKLTDLDKQARKKGSALTERVIGGEMEGVGLIATPQSEGLTPWLIVKGISDFADEDHGKDVGDQRAQACQNAITLVLDALAFAPLPEESALEQEEAEVLLPDLGRAEQATEGHESHD